MEAALPMLALVLGLAPVGYLVWRTQRAQARARGWIDAGEAMGLRFERRVLPVVNVVFERLVGERGGAPVEVWTSGDGDERSIHAKACFVPPAVFGLRATTHPSAPASAVDGPEIRTHALPGWRVHAHDAERAAALLTRLDALLRRYPADGRDLSVEDAGVIVAARAEGTRADLASLLDEALTVRRRVLDALAGMGPDAQQRAAAEAWAAVAQREGFSFDPSTGRLHGRTDRFTVEVHLEHGSALQTTLSFTLAQPARGRVILGRQHEGSNTYLALLGQVATPTGDPAFDARFRASAVTREASAAVLDEGARAALLELPEPIWGGDIAGPSLTLRADGVLSEGGLTEALRTVDRLAAELARLPAGGYRDPA